MTTKKQLQRLIEVGDREYADSILGASVIVYGTKVKKKRDYSILKHPIVAGTIVGLILAVAAWLLGKI
tara:strand:- start:60 stop:263 length:204 start_codon:yes stop_codon:yes gene_type:complete